MLFIQVDTGGAGTGTVLPETAFGNLVVISNMDVGIGEGSPVGDLRQITYNQSLTGPCPDRLNTLVNTDFPGVAGTIDIIVLAVDGSFMTLDSMLITVRAGVSLPPHNSGLPGANLNPTNSVMVIYDTSQNNGQGYSVAAEGGGNVGSPTPVILYHELSHALRAATSSSLSTSASGCAASPEEHAAELDENQMRDQLGVAHRDSTNHCATTGNPITCCIVASIASGSPYSEQVNSLRHVRDNLLRWSDVGFDFFDRLHYDYYGFSPEVCRLMAVSAELHKMIGLYFVAPLAHCLKLVHDYTVGGCEAEELGARFETGFEDLPEVAALTTEDLTRARALLKKGQDVREIFPGPMLELQSLVNERARTSPFVSWALLETIEIYVTALEWRLEGVPTEEIGRRLAERFDQWGARLPLTDVWRRLSKYAIGEELAFLKRSLLRTGEARAQFGLRFLEYFDGDEELHQLLETMGFSAERVLL